MTNQERIQKLLGYPQGIFSEMVEKAGYRWMERFFYGNNDMKEIIAISGQYWKWWVNQWEIRDADFLYRTSLRFLDEPLTGRALEIALSEYVDAHSVRQIVATPNPLVIAELNKLIHERMAQIQNEIKKAV